MYTSNDIDTRDDYEDADYEEEREYVEEESFYEKNKNIIFKVLIIILCIIILIWLISKLSKKKEVPSNYDANVTQVRLASEQYFFINNKPGTEKQSITLSHLINGNLIKEVKNTDGTVCKNDSLITLENNGIDYIMTITLDCGKEKTAKSYYYRVSDYKCENCNGETYMNGNNGDQNPDDPGENPADDDTDKYTCDWSAWTTERNYNSNLIERTRVVVKAMKQETEEKVVYGEWSDYSEVPVTPSDTLEVETKTDSVDTWVDKTSSSPVYESDTIRNVTKSTSGGSSYTYCPSGYEKADGRCRKGQASRTISATEYVSLSGEERKSCSPKRETPNKLVYVCGGGYTYTDLKTGYHSGSTTYHYQELSRTTTTLYRSRTKTVEIVVTEPVYTDYILESEIPTGYTKVAGSERTEYSYKLSSCGTK